MDPGNWASSLAGGAKFGYTLLSVALISNIMAIILQALCARLAIGSGRDLAQACRDAYPRWIVRSAVARRRDRHHRHRPRRGDRHRDRAQPHFRHSPRDRRAADRPRRVPDPLPAEAGLSLSRGAGHRTARRHHCLLCRADRTRRSAVGPVAARLRADHGGRAQPGDALYRHEHPRRHRHAAQSLSALGDRADARLGRHAAREARGAALRHLRFHIRADVRARHQRLDPDSCCGQLLQGRPPRYRRAVAGARRCCIPCSDRRWRRRCSASRSCVAASTRR